MDKFHLLLDLKSCCINKAAVRVPINASNMGPSDQQGPLGTGSVYRF